MSRYRVLKNYKRIKRNRRRLEKFGTLCCVLGIGVMLMCSGEPEGDHFARQILFALSGISVACFGCYILNFVDRINKEYPMVHKMID